MAGQGITRREVVRMMAIASVATTFPGFRRWAFACNHQATADGLTTIRPAGSFIPQFFTAEEFQLVDHLTGLIIPADDSPGAIEAGVAEFIDFMVANGSDLASHSKGVDIRDRFRVGLKWIDSHSQKLYATSFLKSSAQQQVELLEHVAYKERHRDGENDGREFFQVMRD